MEGLLFMSVKNTKPAKYLNWKNRKFARLKWNYIITPNEKDNRTLYLQGESREER